MACTPFQAQSGDSWGVSQQSEPQFQSAHGMSDDSGAQEGSSGYQVFLGIELPGIGSDGRLFSLQTVIKLSIGSPALLQQGAGTFLLLMNEIAMKLFGLLKSARRQYSILPMEIRMRHNQPGSAGMLSTTRNRKIKKGQSDA